MSTDDRTYSVRGRVTDADNNPVSHTEVFVFWQHIRQTVLLGKAHTSESGEYKISYDIPKNPPGVVLIFVETILPYHEEKVKSELTVARPELEIDLHASEKDTSEFALLLRSVLPLLEGLPLAEVVETTEHQDITFLAKETNKTKEQIIRLVIAERLGLAYQLPAAAFFAFLFQRIPSSLPSPLFDATEDFTLIDGLVQRIGSLTFALSSSVQQATLEKAIQKNIIGKRFAKNLPEILNRLNQHRSTNALQQPYLVGKTSLTDLLNIAQLPKKKHDAFANALTQNTQKMSRFWSTLGNGQHGFTQEEALSIQRTLSMGILVKNHAPLLELLLKRYPKTTPDQLSQLARMSVKEWEDLIDQVGAPPNLNPAGEASAAKVFALGIYTRVTRAYPTVALASRLISDKKIIPEKEQGPLDRFFTNNSPINLLRHNLTTYINQDVNKAFEGIKISDRPGVIANAKRIQRVLFVTPDVDVAQTIFSMGIHSATQIAMMGRDQFFSQSTALGISNRQANRVYNTATQRYAGVISLYTQMNRDAVGIWPQAIGDPSGLDGPIADVIAKDQSLSTLFGSQDYCEVDSCTSILSPAAYLCDLLYWLRFRMTGGNSALDILKRRRPDIPNLKLNCPNTQTPMPFIDIVNELLADAIRVPTVPNSTINPLWKQTSGNKTASELRAAPEYFNADAFAVLFGANYPHSLPYSEGLDELRAYLQQSGIALWQLRNALLPLHGVTIAQSAAVASERFLLTPHAVEIITAPDFIAANIAWNTAAPTNDLVAVPAFMHAAMITYDQLFELLQCGWVQGGLGVAIQGINDLCDTSVQTLAPAPLNAGFLDRADRFLRLWRKTKYPMWQLDMLMQSTAVVNGTLDASGLIALGAFRLLQDTTKSDVDAQLAWFQNMDVQVHTGPKNTATIPLYSRVFLNPAVVSLHPDADVAAIVSGAPITDSNLNNHLAVIQASLNISGSDADALVELFGLNAVNTLTLANLSLLYRVTQLVNAARISITDLQSIAPLINSGAPNTSSAITMVFASVDSASTFLQQVKALQQSGFTTDALVYLLTRPAGAVPLWNATTAITDASISTALTAVRQAILNPSGGDVNGSVVAAMASQLGIANDITSFVMQSINLPATARTLLAVLTDASITNPAGGPYPDTTRVNYPDQYAAIQLMDKIRVIVQRLHLVAADLSWLVNNAAVYGGIDFAQLPVLITQPSLSTDRLLTTVTLVKLARLFNAAPPAAAIQNMYALIDGVQSGTLANAAAVQQALSVITGWDVTDISAFCTALGVVFTADYLLPATYDSLRKLEAMISATNGKASATQFIQWGAVPANEDAAQVMAGSALNVVKSRYSNPEWLSIAPSISNPLREHRSAALQDYLIGNGDQNGNRFADVNSLFDFFLIDTQMSSCEVTTRVVQDYIGAQIFVERCRMNLEAPEVVINNNDDAWDWWRWMKRYRIWEAARQVFLYPENWLIESQRPTRTEIFKKLEQDVHQNEHTTDYFETVSLNYIDGLDHIAHLHITGTCQDPVTKTIHVIGRSHADPPRFYHRSYCDGVWSGWVSIPLDIKSHHAIPVVYRNHLCVFWPETKVHNEPHQVLPSAQASSTPPSQDTSKYVSISLYFTMFRNNNWMPGQAAKGKLFDIPALNSETASDSKSVEALYTLKAQHAQAGGNYGASLLIDVFRFGDYSVNAFAVSVNNGPWNTTSSVSSTQPTAVHIGRSVFDGRFSDLELRGISTIYNGPGDLSMLNLLTHAQKVYGHDAEPLIPLTVADPDLATEPGLAPKAGSLVTNPRGVSDPSTIPLSFTSLANQLPTSSVTLLNTAQVPFRVIGPDDSLVFDPTAYFFYQDSRRCYYVEPSLWYWTGSMWTQTEPSNPASMPHEASYYFHRFYHPYTRLLLHQLGSEGFPGIYNTTLQETPDQIDPSHADVFSFPNTYHPAPPWVHWGEDNEILDFAPNAAYSIYNWELFFHNPLYVAGLLSQNLQFEDAMKWYHYIFDPTKQGSDPAPQRFWIPKPLHNLTSTAVQAQRINNLLALVNQGDPDAIAQVRRWRDDPFNPYLLADMRPVAYMKNVVMAYLDNIMAWADNLFATDSREALSEATLLYVIASEILGPEPSAIRPPQHADESYTELEPKLDVFANAMVDIENSIGAGGGGMGSGGSGGIPPPQTFYFKIPPNEKLLGYWTTVNDRLNKLRHCQNLQGVTRSLALFDAPIDPGLLIKAQAAGVDLGSVLSDLSAPLPNYRYTVLYGFALDFVNAVRAYGTSLAGAIEKSDAAALSILQQTIAQDIQRDTDQIFQWQIDKAQHDLDALNEALALAESKYEFNHSQSYMNAAEIVDTTLGATFIGISTIALVLELLAGGLHLIPEFIAGVSGFGGTPAASGQTGGTKFGTASQTSANSGKTLGTILDKSGTLARQQGSYLHRRDAWEQAAKEADIQRQQTVASIAGAEVTLAIAEQNQVNHQNQIDYIQKQLDFLNDKFTNQDLYDWQVSKLSETYFQSYKLAYRLCKQVERCYQYELGIPDSDFIQFGYWDSLHKGLLAGETLNHDLRRMQSSYLDQNKRRFEISRYVSLAAINPAAVRQLLLTGACDFDFTESLFDNDYPGHYNRHLVRVSVTVVYPGPGKFDNVKATLVLTANKVRLTTDATSSADYGETGPGDTRFAYNYAAVSQKIVLGNAQDDPGLFVTAIGNNITDQRYLPFEGAGAISSWHFEMPEETNEIDTGSVSDVVFHLYYTAIDGGDALKAIVAQSNIDNQPTTGVRVFSARNDFAAPSPTMVNQFPLSPWDAFLQKPAAADPDQSLVLSISPSKFPSWTRGKTITITGITVLTAGWPSGDFKLQPQDVLTQAAGDLTMTTVAGSPEPNLTAATLVIPANLQPGKWTFKLRTVGAADFRSLTRNDISDILLFLSFKTT